MTRAAADLPPPLSARPAVAAKLMAQTGLDEALLTKLVHRFYEKVRADTVLGPIFAARIEDWGPHLEWMESFWSSVALMTGRYHGAPVPKHAELPVSWEHFERWLAPFGETVHEVCRPERAAHLIERAERIARSVAHLCSRGAGASRRRFDAALTKGHPLSDVVPIHHATELTRFIESRYHPRHREQLRMRLKLAEMVEDLHCDEEGVPTASAISCAGWQKSWRCT